jgi:hypothetical protein
MSVLGRTLVKLAVSRDRLRVPQTRKGRRPMSVDTFLRKERDGSLYHGLGVDGVEKQLDNTLGLKVRNLLQKRTLAKELVGRVAEEFEDKLSAAHVDQIPGGLADKSKPSDFPKEQLQKGTKVEKEHVGNNSALAEEIAMDHLKEHPEYYTALDKMEKGLEEKKAEAGPWESKLPWYTTAAGATGLGLMGQNVLPKKYKALGAVGGALLGTGLGLESGTRLGKGLDKPRRKLRKEAGSQQPMQRMFGEGASRGIQHVTMIEPETGTPAVAKTKKGDAPSRDELPVHAGVQQSPSIREMDLAPKVAAEMKRLLNRDQFPTNDEGPERDQAVSHSRGKTGLQEAGADALTTLNNPNWRAK